MIDAIFCAQCVQYYLADSCTVQKDGTQRGYVCPKGHLPVDTRRNNAIIEGLDLLKEIVLLLKVQNDRRNS